MKEKISLKKALSFILVLTMLVCALFITSANAETAAGEWYPLGDSGFSWQSSSWSTPSIICEDMEKKLPEKFVFTEKQFKQLGEALESANFDKYELITGEDYIIKNIKLNHGYSIEIASATPNDMENQQYFFENAIDYKNSKDVGLYVFIKDKSGNILIQFALMENCIYKGTTQLSDGRYVGKKLYYSYNQLFTSSKIEGVSFSEPEYTIYTTSDEGDCAALSVDGDVVMTLTDKSGKKEFNCTLQVSSFADWNYDSSAVISRK